MHWDNTILIFLLSNFLFEIFFFPILKNMILHFIYNVTFHYSFRISQIIFITFISWFWFTWGCCRAASCVLRVVMVMAKHRPAGRHVHGVMLAKRRPRRGLRVSDAAARAAAPTASAVSEHGTSAPTHRSIWDTEQIF